MTSGVHRDPDEIALSKRPGVVGDPQGLGQSNIQLVADTFPPMAQARALVGQLVLEEFLASEVVGY